MCSIMGPVQKRTLCLLGGVKSEKLSVLVLVLCPQSIRLRYMFATLTLVLGLVSLHGLQINKVLSGPLKITLHC